MKISTIAAYQVFDSRGTPTIEAVVTLAGGLQGTAIAPSGASTGQYEALELRDKNPRIFRGKSVLQAIANIEEVIAPALRGLDPADQAKLDKVLIELDGTPNKTKLGANAILAVSMAAARAAAQARRLPLFAHLGTGTLLPLPEIQIFGGGAHASWRIDVQDFMIVAVGARSYAETLEITHNVYHAAGDLLREQGRLVGVADEGGYWPDFASHVEAFELLLAAIRRAGYEAGREVAISLDFAASDLFDGEKYHLKLEAEKFTSDEFIELIESWCKAYPIISIEDPLADTDWNGWKKIAARLRGKVQLIGDDLFTTNLARIERGIDMKAASAVLIKLNQIGTVTETLAAIRRTQAAGWQPVVSARSGETEDTFISHLAVATSAGQLKVGSFARSERMCKWNEVLRIERELGDKARFIGAEVFTGRGTK